MKKLALLCLASSMALTPKLAFAQTVRTQDISVQLQSSLESASPTVVYFAFDKDEILPEAKLILDQQAAWLNSNPEAKVDLAGHTDAVGSNEYNYELAMRRAKAVESYLLTHGVNAAQMRSVVSQGESNLAVTTQKRERLNRRVKTSVTGLVEIVDAAPPPAPQAPPPREPRSYAEDSPPSCDGRSRTTLASMSDLKNLRSELQTRLNLAADDYQNDKTISNTNYRFNLVAFTKAECGKAIGFTKKSIRDERSISNCDCYSSLLGAETL